MASVYELYLGGPRQQNTDWAIFPAAPFNVANVSNLAPPSKTPLLFGASRTLDFVNDKALGYFYKKNMLSTPVVGDSLGLVVIPSNSLLLGLWYKITGILAGTGGSFTLKVRGTGKLFGAFDPHVLGSNFLQYDAGTAPVTTTNATLGGSLYKYFAAPDIVDLVLTTLPTPIALTGLVLTVTPVYYNFQTGMMN
jgi:hypothetical protein